jgi:hypothetical protein
VEYDFLIAPFSLHKTDATVLLRGILEDLGMPKRTSGQIAEYLLRNALVMQVYAINKLQVSVYGRNKKKVLAKPKFRWKSSIKMNHIERVWI